MDIAAQHANLEVDEVYPSDSDIDLQVPDLATLHERRSEKWSVHEPDVLASTVAEMDFPLARRRYCGTACGGGPS